MTGEITMPEVKSKSAAKSAATAKKAAAKQGTSVTPEERYHMIAEAAYFHAERRGFTMGDAAQDWLEAEAEIDRILQHPRGKGSLLTAKQEFQQKLEAQLREWDAKLDELKTKAQEAKSEIKADYEKQLEVLSDKRATAQAKIQELRLRTEDAWEDLKGGTEKAWDEMRKALDQIASRFK
jgi:chromosome segregation ATPase